jgi:hypothetical protein
MPKWFQKERLHLGPVTPIDIPRVEAVYFYAVDYFLDHSRKGFPGRTSSNNKNLMSFPL